MKYIVITLLLVALTGCGAYDRFGAQMTGSSESCIGGVAYLQFASGVTVAYTPDGKIKNCI